MRRGAEALPRRVPWISVIVFVAIAVIAGWAVCIPFWIEGSLESVDSLTFQLLLIGLMFTPTLAALVTVFLVQRPKHPVSMLGLRIRPAGRTILISVVAWLAPPVLFVLGVIFAAALGFVEIDLTFQAFRDTYMSNLQMLGSTPEMLTQFEAMPTGALVAMTLAEMLTITTVIASLSAFGEELGWRGWLLPALRPLGTWPAILISCVIWALWHAPIILLGYNFMDRSVVGLLFMIGFCVSVGIFCSWVRLRSATVYPAAIAHGSINASATVVLFLFVGNLANLDQKVVGVGWTAWVPFLVAGVILVLLGQFRRQPLPGLKLAESAIALERRDATRSETASVAATAK